MADIKQQQLQQPGLKSYNSDDSHKEYSGHTHKEYTNGLAQDNLVQNDVAKVVNPLRGLSKEELYGRVDQFCDSHGFHSDVELFRRGAMAAQHSVDFEMCQDIPEDDKAILRRARDHRWDQPFTLWFSVAVLSLGAMVQGWDNTGANGANLGFPQEFGIADRPTLVGVVNAAPLLAGVVATWFADPANYYLGRRGVLFVTGLFCIGPVLGQAFTQSWQELVACRVLMGIAMSIKTSSLPIYSAEITPASIRGGLTMFWQLWVAFGILAGFVCNLIFYQIGDNAWRFMLGGAFAPAVPLVFMCWFCPESPRWLIKKGRFQKAWTSFKRLRKTELEAAQDMFYAWVQIDAEREVFGGTSYFKRFTELWTIPRIRRASIGGAVVMLAQQFSGINIMAFYSSTIFAESGLSTRSVLLSSLGFGLVNTTFALPAIWTIDRFGRRSLLLFTFPLMALFLFLVAGSSYLSMDNAARLPLIATFIYIYTALYSPGIGPVPNVYASESFPLSHREMGGSWSIFVNQATSTVLTMTFPDLLASIDVGGCFFFYGGLNLFATFLVFNLLPETKQMSLEELDQIFAVPTSKFAKYQWGTWLPYFVRRYIKMDRTAHLEPLYQLDGIQGKTMVDVVGH